MAAITDWGLAALDHQAPPNPKLDRALVVQEDAFVDFVVGGVFVSDLSYRDVVEAVDLGVVVGEEDGGVGGDDELGVAGFAVFAEDV